MTCQLGFAFKLQFYFIDPDVPQAKGTLRFLYFILGWSFLILGILGAFLPLLPTTPFVLLALFFFSRSSEKWSLWILNHRVLGPPIHRWREKKAIKKNVKIWAISILFLSFSLSIYLVSHSLWLVAGLLTVFVILLFFLARLPTNDEELRPPALSRQKEPLNG